MSLRFVSPGAISCACEEVRAPAFVARCLLGIMVTVSITVAATIAIVRV